MLQIVYISTPRPDVDPAIEDILASATRNNGRADVTGLLLFDGRRFMQVLEGPAAAVEATFERIKADPRHFAIVTLSQRRVEQREFGSWKMAYRKPGDDAGGFRERLSALLADAAPSIRGTFEGLASVRAA